MSDKAARSTEHDPSSPTGREALLRELALRLLTRHPGQLSAADAQLLPGQVPGDLPVTLPLPDDRRVIGSFVHRDQHARIMFDTHLSPDQVLQFYDNHLRAAGWTRDPAAGGRFGGGFLSSAWATLPTLFCRGVDGPALWIHADQSGTATSVELHLEIASAHSPCAERPPHPGLLWDPIPALPPPPNSRQFSEGGGRSERYAHELARLETALDLAAVGAHYRDRLAQAGWTLRNAGESGPCAWSSGTFRDEESNSWYGIFTALEHPDMPRRYYLQVCVERAGGDWGDTGGGTAMPRIYSGWSPA